MRHSFLHFRGTRIIITQQTARMYLKSDLPSTAGPQVEFIHLCTTFLKSLYMQPPTIWALSFELRSQPSDATELLNIGNSD